MSRFVLFVSAGVSFDGAFSLWVFLIKTFSRFILLRWFFWVYKLSEKVVTEKSNVLFSETILSQRSSILSFSTCDIMEIKTQVIEVTKSRGIPIKRAWKQTKKNIVNRKNHGVDKKENMNFVVSITVV